MENSENKINEIEEIKARKKAPKLKKGDVRKAFARGKAEAKKLMKGDGKLEELLQQAEAKLKTVPKLGNELGSIPALISLVRSYLAREYRQVPKGAITAAVVAIAYFVAPIDIIPDMILGSGLVDDAVVIGFCLKNISSDLKNYLKWRKDTGRLMLDIPNGSGPDIFDAAKAPLLKKLKK